MISAIDMDKIARQIDWMSGMPAMSAASSPKERRGAPPNMKPKQELPDWWDDFWQRHERNTGQSREEAIEMLRRLRPHWQPANELELPQALGDLEQSNNKSNEPLETNSGIA